MSSNGDSTKDSKAQAKADKAFKKASRPWFKKKRFWAIAIIAIFAIGNAVSGGGSSSTSSNQESASTETEVAAVAVTAEQLLSELEANALAAKNTWNDKKVVITGTLDNIDASGKYFSLRGDTEITFINVQIYIDDSFTSVVSSFKKGQSVTVTGEITDVGELLGYSVKAISIP
jgi:ribosomal protein S1